MAESLPPSSSAPDASDPDRAVDAPRRSDGAIEERSGSSRRRVPVSERAKAGGLAKQDKKSARALTISVGLHVAAGVVLLQFLTFGHGLSFFGFNKDKEPREERLTFVTPPAPRTPPPVTTVPTKPQTTPPKLLTGTPQFRAPTTGPEVGTPTVSAPVAARPDTGSGGAGDPGAKGVGALDPNVRGVKPGYTDARVWRGSGGGGAGVAPGRTGAERLDSIMRFAITSTADSLDSLARSQGRTGKKPGDWTKTGPNGEKWGWDQTGIRLGKVTIPNALLALLPMNAQRGMSGNFTDMDRERRLAASRADIMRNSERSLGEAEFQKLVNELRDRREKERRDRLRAPDASVVGGKSGTP